MSITVSVVVAKKYPTIEKPYDTASDIEISCALRLMIRHSLHLSPFETQCYVAVIRTLTDAESSTPLDGG